MRIRPLEPRDFGAVLAIQSRSPEAARWTRADYGAVVRGEWGGWIAEEAAAAAGFLVARRTGEEMEILNLAVRPENRLRGAGKLLLGEALRWGRESGAVRAFLEVRASNHVARRFYAANGFAAAGLRPNYYRDPAEDAVVLAAGL